MWAGALTNFEIFIYGAVLMAFFGVSFAQAVVIIVVGNLSYLLVGLTSLQGPDAGTTTFIVNRAPFGQNGNRLVALFNWLTQVGFEAEGLALVVLAGIALTAKAGFHAGTTWKILLIVAAAGIQLVLPLFGHGTILRTLRWLAAPFAALFVVLAVLTLGKLDVHSVHHGAGWASWMAALAFIIVTSGLGWTENGNDYSRYVPRQADKRAIVGWVFAGTFIPSVLLMFLGAAVGTYVPSEGGNPITTLPHVFSGWFLVPFLVVAVMQLFAINSLDLYSSGVTLQALGLRLKRWQAVLVDTVVAGGLTAYAIFSSSFNTLLSDFVACVIVWIAPWTAIFLVDWVLRRYRYVPGDLQRTTRGPVLAQRRRALAGRRGPGRRHVRRPHGAEPVLLRGAALLAHRRSRLQRLPRPRGGGAGLPAPGRPQGAAGGRRAGRAPGRPGLTSAEMADEHADVRALSFGSIAEEYDRYRPGPPPDAVAWVLDGRRGLAVEVGAGTGALTRELVRRVDRVVAVEPDRRMGSVLAARLAGVPVAVGRAEELPLVGGAAEAVVGSSMWHWVEPGAVPARPPGCCAPAGCWASCGAGPTARRTGWPS